MAHIILKAEQIKYLQELVDADASSSKLEDLRQYGSDETEDLCHPPELLLKPKNTAEVSSILAYCNKHEIPLTAIGARTGLSGGALCLLGGVGLSLERMNRIIEIDERNYQITVEPGVITQVMQDAVAAKGLFYPPDPSSRGSCFIGGNLANNSGGPKAVKYGVTREYVLNLEVVLASGEIIWTGANVLKNSTGYSLTHLMVGSEGTLGIITKAVLKLIPLPQNNVLMLVPFVSAREACEAVSAVFRAGIVPSAMEFMERDAIDWILDFDKEIKVEVKDEKAHLLIELDGNNIQQLQEEAQQVVEVLSVFNIGDILYAEDETQKQVLWRMRRRVAEAVKSNSVYKEEDTVVPRYHLPQLLDGIKEIGSRYGFKSVCYGHAGDGNLHVNIIKGDLSSEYWNSTLKIAIRELFVLVKKLGGTISGEHGIGLVQKEYMDIIFPDFHLDLFRKIKFAFDPKGILNPGKIIPDEVIRKQPTGNSQ